MRLQDFKVVYICPNHNDKYRARKIYMDDLLTKLGFTDFEHYQSGSERYPACLSIATQHILRKYIDVPILLLEDDIEFTGHDSFKWDASADAIYFGLSLCGSSMTANTNNDGCILEPHSKSMVRAMNMNSTHAVMYITKEYKLACIEALNDHAIYNDIALARIMSKFNVYAMKIPAFWQSTKFNDGNNHVEKMTKIQFVTRVHKYDLSC